ncbi:MAG: hypothetical protein JWM86_2546 [Thermoleophilia bacterium]|nr:hypothetical protein [Thermoleophilia bacterium]
MQSVVANSFLAFGAVSIGASTAIDIAIDRNGHDHSAWVYTHANTVPKAVKAVGAGLVLAGLGAKLLPQTRPISNTIIKVGVGAIAAWGVTNWGWRLGMAAVLDARNGGLHWNPGDVAKNSLDRTHMMGREPQRAEKTFEDLMSRLQGHGPLDDRIARGDFIPMWKPGEPPPGL